MSYDSAVDQDRSTTPLDRSSDDRSGQYKYYHRAEEELARLS